MVDRIEKLKSSEPWKIAESAETKKDKREQSKEEGKRDDRSSFGEKTDWNRLIAKDSGPRETLNLLTSNIKSLEFKGVSTWRDQAALEVDVLLEDGTRKDSALISIPRAQGLKLVHHHPGDSVPLELFGKDPYLKVSLLMHPTLLQTMKVGEEKTGIPPETPSTSEEKGQILFPKEAPEAFSILWVVLYSIVACLLLIAIVGLVRFLI
jgi:hypothetical protein